MTAMTCPESAIQKPAMPMTRRDRPTAEQNCRTHPAASARRATARLLAFILALAAGSPPTAAQGEASTAAARNGYGQILQSTARPAAGTPYTPIRQHDDQAQIPEIEMFVGETRVFPAPGVARIAVGNGQLMSAAALDEREIIVFANAVGTSSLFVWNADGRYQRVKVNIVPGDTSRFAREIAAFLTTIPNARASVIGDKVIVEGDKLSDDDLAKIEELAKRYPQIVNFTNRLGWEQMVLMDVKVVEFPVNELREIGLRWQAVGGTAIGAIWQPIRQGNNGPYQVNIQAGENNAPPITNPDGTRSVPLPASLNVLSAVNLGLKAQLNLLAQDGKASVLAEPQLSARNGSRASFLAGGEFPYSVSNINGVTVIFKPYGVKLDVLPRVDRHGTIRATIEAEVSSIDPSVSTASGPALLTRKTHTEFNVRSGETIVLSGLLQRDSSTSIDKVPFLGDLPVLGALFRSTRFQNKETELVVFVTPSVVDSRSPGLVDRIDRTTERLTRDLGAPPFLSAPLQPGHDPAQADTEPPPSESAPGNVPKPAPVSAVREHAPIVPAEHGNATPGMPEPSPFPAARTLPASGVESAVPRGGSTLQVTRHGLPLRAAPGTSHPILLHLGRGALVQLGNDDVRTADGHYWVNAIVGALDGWVARDGIEPASLEPATSASAIGTMIERDRLAPSVTASGAAPGRAITANAPAVAAAPARYRVVLDRLALRVSPDINAGALRHLAKDELVDALPQPPISYWTAIQAGDQRGWVATQWLAREF
jgi:pilus assembly protein CpaC